MKVYVLRQRDGFSVDDNRFVLEPAPDLRLGCLGTRSLDTVELTKRVDLIEPVKSFHSAGMIAQFVKKIKTRARARDRVLAK